MLYGRLDAPETFMPLMIHPIWREALAWLSAMPANIPAGIHPLRGEEMFANVHGYDTRPREACRYEAHRRYIDLQFCRSGGEIIEWHPLAALTPIDAYEEKKDVIHFALPARPDAELRMAAASLAVFYPSDGHMPKRFDEQHSRVEKAVIKISLALIR